MACVYIIIFICDSELENRIHLFRHYNITMYECNKQSKYVLCIRSIGFNIITMTSIVWMLLLLWFFFFASSFVLYLIYVVSRSIGVRNRNAIYTYICWSSILAWPTINTVCLFPALYHTICIPLYYISIPSSCAPQMTQVIQAIVLFNSWMFTSYLAAHRNIAKASVCGKRFANARNCTVYGWGTTNQIN